MTRVQKALLGLAAGVTLLQGVGAFLPGPANWAFHFYAFLPRGLLVGFGGLALLSFLPPVQGALARLLAPLARALEGQGARGVALGAIGLLLMAFWFGRTRLFLLSDSQLLVKSVQQGAVAFTADTLSAALQLYANYLMKKILHVASETASFRVLSLGCGLVWLGALFATVGRLTPSGWARLLMGGLLGLAGITRLFYGYAETSPLLAAGVAVYIWTAVRLLQDRKGLPAVTAALLLVVALHVTGLLLLPSYGFLLYVWAAGQPRRRAAAAGLVALPVVAYAVYWFVRGGTVQRVGEAYSSYFTQFIPLAGPLNAKQAYTQLSLARWYDFFNEQLLLGPFALVGLVVVLAVAGRRAWGSAPVVRFLGWMLLPLLLLALVFMRYLGGSRDWDLFANLAVPALLLVALALVGDASPAPAAAAARTRPSALPAVTVTLLAVGLFQQAGWVLIDTRPATGLERFRHLMSDGAPISPWARAYALTDLSNYYLDHGAPQEAVTQLEQAVRLSPGNSFAAGSLGALYLDAGRVQEALPLMRRAARLRPDVAMNQYNLAGALARNGKLDSAAVAYAASLRLNPRFMQAYQNMGLVLTAQGRRAEADSIWRAGLALFPAEVGLYNNVGTNQEAMGQPERALETYQAALKLRPDDGNIIFNLARLLQQMNRPTEAQPLLERLVQAEPQNGEASVNLGLIYEQQGRIDDAMKAYSHAMAVNRKLPPAYLNLARLMVGRQDEPGAVQVLESFLENDPENAKKVGVEQFLLQVRQKAAADSAR